MITAIIRHRRENLKKCSLSGLEKREGLLFYTYPTDPLPDFSGFLLLKVGAPPLTSQDATRNLLLIDGTWALSLTIEKQLPPLETRSLPGHFRTAYPRRQTHCPDPEAGLSSVEALYLAHKILGRPYSDLLEFYYWQNRFLLLNKLS
jgi:rRNA small subunit aminocarboxypropyltransferase